MLVHGHLLWVQHQQPIAIIVLPGNGLRQLGQVQRVPASTVLLVHGHQLGLGLAISVVLELGHRQLRQHRLHHATSAMLGHGHQVVQPHVLDVGLELFQLFWDQVQASHVSHVQQQRTPLVQHLRVRIVQLEHGQPHMGHLHAIHAMPGRIPMQVKDPAYLAKQGHIPLCKVPHHA